MSVLDILLPNTAESRAEQESAVRSNLQELQWDMGLPTTMRHHIGIIYLWDLDFKPVRDITQPHALSWAADQSYDFIEIPYPQVERNIQWHRVKILEELLPFYDCILHLDADVLITNPKTRLELFLRPGMDLGMSREPNGVWNDGTSLFMNTPAMREALPKIWDAEAPDATSANGVIQKWYDQGTLPFNLVEIPKRQFNSYADDWQPGDFVLHLPGTSNEKRCEIFKRVLEGGRP